jgi:hypothetical protein
VRPVSFDPALGDVAVEQVHAAGVALLADLAEQTLDGHGGVLGAAGAQVITVGSTMVARYLGARIIRPGSAARA